ncbi:hypothetical protein A3C98_04050 [Candidatus Roizmanbacteria bacterium RIFCSPHIGHO2_02_FULL_37_15]|uniref:Transcription regulator TrmB N-terminal domain-containing protein n=1 Tax=Candidatus Roizmanbacteria bacterium RIFCSPLOWO2_01_FULL_37_16 TaxID=1802058 RepID=A0A1F7IMI3_9BACT|nr:MAG: hypothetical protein A2859_04210 [Candidatus Roizmanbacteria bacterium RIFCSPHIGHO2_01_FULL_37_16b]OGK22495.1 MAG: hypothetical protein A3C98_04050 [Candidatus Roizmanbacteria bacterium RIFCSPHIGHO2_02_FULL_37_15]OGK33553.1 MAG: hypothetical protein A3F57_05625 [Candidatus Roizmanbacteria bacterium RIFCSPHIGHO2_12_FULL_36_11]OGK44577.1 MAG: hypothetical protein A3B40_05330 [Candidatus Roizmanbacteria bacterium RIFCSPLOWO2_01_FULL_37_16]OGK56855.1 MAG: hypothetical protein A3I50_03210 [C
MSIQTDNLPGLLEPFGLSQEEARIYLYLVEKRITTALSVSRHLHLGRTKVYRLLDKLIEKQLAVQRVDSAGFKFVANDPSQLDILLFRKEGEVAVLRKSLPQILATLKSRLGVAQPGSQIIYYRGKNGLSQVNWNLLRAKMEFASFEVATANAYLPKREAEKLRRQLVEKKIMTRTITNRKIIESFTEVSEMVSQWWQIRHIPSSILKIQADIFIYNDVYTACHYLEDGDIFCFEMYNRQLAEMQKQLFENLWKQAKKMEIVNDHGKAIITK